MSDKVGVYDKSFTSFSSFMEAKTKASNTNKTSEDPLKDFAFVAVNGFINEDSELTEDSVLHSGKKK